MTDQPAAAEALARVHAVNANLAARVNCPPAYHIAFGLLLGAMVAGQALPATGALAVLVVSLGALAFMVRWQRRRLGVFINGYRRGRTRVVAVGLLVGVEALLFGSIWLKLHDLAWAPLAAGILAAGLAVAGSYIWQAAYRADLASSQ